MFTAIFIVGTGRSGTHFTTRVLNGYANVFDPLHGKENEAVLRSIAEAAINHRPPSAESLSYYADIASRRAAGQVFLDQHHPNLFFIDSLLQIFPDAIFLYPRRPVVQIVSSMLEHKGVLSWYAYARENKVPFPNRFLGLKDRAELSELKLHMLCAKRVLAHEEAVQSAQERWPDRVRVIDYEALVLALNEELARVFSDDERRGLGSFRLLEQPSPASLVKYKSNLTTPQIDEISRLQV